MSVFIKRFEIHREDGGLMLLPDIRDYIPDYTMM
jgi:hypothetical protein